MLILNEEFEVKSVEKKRYKWLRPCYVLMLNKEMLFVEHFKKEFFLSEDLKFTTDIRQAKKFKSAWGAFWFYNSRVRVVNIAPYLEAQRRKRAVKRTSKNVKFVAKRRVG